VYNGRMGVLSIVGIVVSFFGALGAWVAVCQNFKARKVAISVRATSGHNVSGPDERKGAHITVLAENVGLVAVKIEDLFVVHPSLGRIKVETHGSRNGNLLPKLVVPGDAFDYIISDSELVEGDTVSHADAFVEVVTVCGSRYKSAPLHE